VENLEIARTEQTVPPSFFATGRVVRPAKTRYGDTSRAVRDVQLRLADVGRLSDRHVTTAI
jgi:hypothetical protein